MRIETLEQALEQMAEQIKSPKFAIEIRNLLNSGNEKVECEISVLPCKQGGLVLHMATKATSVKREKGTLIRLK